jgi:hypothetical protein
LQTQWWQGFFILGTPQIIQNPSKKMVYIETFSPHFSRSRQIAEILCQSAFYGYFVGLKFQ